MKFGAKADPTISSYILDIGLEIASFNNLEYSSTLL